MNRNKQRDINKYNYQGKYTNEKTRDIPFHTMTVEETLLYLNTSLDGLTDEEAVKKGHTQQCLGRSRANPLLSCS